MQASFALLETDGTDTLGEVMEKPRNATGHTPNAAKRSDVERVQRRITDGLKMKFVDAVIAAGLSRPTAFRFQNGTASAGSLARLEEWVLQQEKDRGLRSSDREARLVAEWAELGENFSKLDFADFEEKLEGMREYVAAKKQLTDAAKRLGKLVTV